jgi:hypothetical protein
VEVGVLVDEEGLAELAADAAAVGAPWLSNSVRSTVPSTPSMPSVVVPLETS